MPIEIVVIALAAGFAIWLIATANRQSTAEANAKISEANRDRKIAELEAKVDALQAMLDDIVVGHVDEAQIKRVLSRVLTDQERLER